MKNCYHFKELIRHINYDSPYKPVIVYMEDEYYLLDMMLSETASFKLFKIDMDKFELIEDSETIVLLENNINLKYLKLDELYKIFIQRTRNKKINSIYE